VKLCYGSLVTDWENLPAENMVSHWNAGYGYNGARPTGIKRKRLVCPKCKRRILSSVTTCHDGCCVKHYLPPHKPKMWWKKGKKRKVRK